MPTLQSLTWLRQTDVLCSNIKNAVEVAISYDIMPYSVYIGVRRISQRGPCLGTTGYVRKKFLNVSYRDGWPR